MPTWEMIAGRGGGSAYSASTTYYAALAGVNAFITTEAWVQTRIRDTLTLQNLFVRVITNGTTASSTVRSRVGGANGAQSVSIGAAATGVFEDTVNTDALVAGNLANSQIVVGAGGSLTVTIISFLLVHTTDNVPILVALSNFANAVGATSYTPLHGLGGSNTTEAKSQLTFRVSSTLSNLRAYVSSNTLSTASTTSRLRINGVNSVQALSIGAGATGDFEDTTNTDAVAVADEVNYQTVTDAGGTGSMVIRTHQVKSASAGRQLASVDVGGLAFSADRYHVAEGYLEASTTEVNVQKTARSSFTAKNLFCYVSAHGLSGGVNNYLRKNGANSALTVSIAESTTGVFEDTANTVDFVATDTYNWFLDHGGGAGSITMTILGFELAQPSAVAALNLERIERHLLRGHLRGVMRGAL